MVAFTAAMQAMWDICEEAVEQKPDDTKKELEAKVCTNECSGNGQCVNGTCICKKGFGTEDCSVVVDQVPELLDVGCGRLCDVRKSECNRVVVRSKNLVPDRVKCRSVSTGIDITSVLIWC